MFPDQESTANLDDGKNLRMQKYEWIFERTAWVLMIALLLAAVLGLFGPGPLSFRTRTSADGKLVVDYYAVQRHEAPSELCIHFRDRAAQGAIRVALSRV